MSEEQVAMPAIVDPARWRSERMRLLEEEKKLTREHDRINALRRRLPMKSVDKEYRFHGPEGEMSLVELFQGKSQLIVYHFMFDPEWDEGCPGCTGYVDDLGDLDEVSKRDARFILVSRAPLEKLMAYKDKKGWNVPWYSSYGSDFNYDFHVTLDKEVAPVEYNYRTLEETKLRRPSAQLKGEAPGISVFLRNGDRVYHTYSAFERGVEGTTGAYGLLDITPYGRQQDFEDSPPGWPQRPTYE